MGLDNLVYPYTIDTSKRDTDFTGFSFNGFHSTDLGLVRVSSSDRYEDTFGPQFMDKTVQAPAANRTYYFGTDYTQKPFTLNVAFDSLTEEGLRALRQIFNAKSVGPLIFDEWPYKVYSAKVQSPPQFKYICFDLDKPMEVLVPKEEVFWVDNKVTYFSLQETPASLSDESNWKNYVVLTRVRGNYPTDVILDKIKAASELDEENSQINFNIGSTWKGSGYVKVSYYYRATTRRIYKGEGTIQFVCYYPLARSRYKFLNQYVNRGIDYNLDEWQKASGLLNSYDAWNFDKLNSIPTVFEKPAGEGSFKDKKPKETDQIVYLYNPGDLEADCHLYLWIANDQDLTRNNGITKIQLKQQKGDSPSSSDTIRDYLTFEPAFATPNMTGRKNGDTYLCIDSAKNLIYGCDDSFSPTGSLYNQCIQSGNFFKIPMTPLADMKTTSLTLTLQTKKTTNNEYMITLPCKPISIESITDTDDKTVLSSKYKVDLIQGTIIFIEDTEVKSYKIGFTTMGEIKDLTDFTEIGPGITYIELPVNTIKVLSVKDSRGNIVSSSNYNVVLDSKSIKMVQFYNKEESEQYTIKYHSVSSKSNYYLYIYSQGWGRGLYNLSQDNDVADGNEIDKDTYYYLYY